MSRDVSRRARRNRRMRIIMYTGKGGVGKTSISAATALLCAELGHETLVLSTDAAHSLADCLDVELGPEPRRVLDRLWAQELDTLHELKKNWGKIGDYLATLMSWRGMRDIAAEELAVFPGTEELLSLIQIAHHHDCSRYSVIVVDCAPSGETLRLLSYPDVFRWWMEKLFPLERKAMRVLRSVAQPLVGMPLPTDQVLGSVQEVFAQVARTRAILADPTTTSIRIVVNPERVVVREARRNLTYLCLFGFPADAVILNRLIPAGVSDGYFGEWKEIQELHRRVIHESFAPLPVLVVPLLAREVVGKEMLLALGKACFGEQDPSRVMFAGKPQEIRRTPDGYEFKIRLPFVEKQDISLSRQGDELTATAGAFTRKIVLPRALAGADVRQAKLEDGTLTILFGGENR